MIRRPPRSTLFPLHDALPIFAVDRADDHVVRGVKFVAAVFGAEIAHSVFRFRQSRGVLERSVIELRSEEHTSELQSQSNLVCRLLLEKKKTAMLARVGTAMTR